MWPTQNGVHMTRPEAFERCQLSKPGIVLSSRKEASLHIYQHTDFLRSYKCL